MHDDEWRASPRLREQRQAALRLRVQGHAGLHALQLQLVRRRRVERALRLRVHQRRARLRGRELRVGRARRGRRDPPRARAKAVLLLQLLQLLLRHKVGGGKREMLRVRVRLQHLLLMLLRELSGALAAGRPHTALVALRLAPARARGASGRRVMLCTGAGNGGLVGCLLLRGLLRV